MNWFYFYQKDMRRKWFVNVIFPNFLELFVFSAINLFSAAWPRRVVIFKADISRTFYRQERNYDFWLGSLAKFPLSENSDKIRLTELAKNQTFPLFMTSLRLMLALQPPALHYCWVFLELNHLRLKKHKRKICNQIMTVNRNTKTNYWGAKEGLSDCWE